MTTFEPSDVGGSDPIDLIRGAEACSASKEHKNIVPIHAVS